MTCPICDPSRPTPGSPEMDQCVISCLMQAPDVAVEKALELLKPDDFSVEACGILFDVVTQRHAAGKPVDPVSITTHVYEKGMVEKIGGPAFVSECYTAAPNPMHVHHYAAEVLSGSKKRQMLRIASDLAAAVVERSGGKADEGDWRDAILPILRRADAAVMDGKANSLIHVKEVAMQYAESGIENQVDPPVATGIERLDAILDGGIRREYIIIGGRQGHGKTLLAMQFAGKMANAGRRGLVVGYEMTALQIFMRDIARETRVPLSHVMGRVPFEGNDVQALHRGLRRIVDGWDVFYIDSPYITLESVAAHARTLHRQKPLDFIVIDYLQLVPMKRGKGERSDEMLVALSNQVERLRKELGCTLIAPVQLNDEGLIRDARGILDAPQLFIRIEMEQITNDSGEAETGDNGFLQFLKQRFGKANLSCPVFRNGAYQAFEDRATPDRHPPTQKPRRRAWTP